MEIAPSHSFVDGAVASSNGTSPDASRSDPEPHPQARSGHRRRRRAIGVARSAGTGAARLPVIQFNAERWRPYNRVKLTPFLAGEVQIGLVYQPNLFPAAAPVTQYTGQTHPRDRPRSQDGRKSVRPPLALFEAGPLPWLARAYPAHSRPRPGRRLSLPQFRRRRAFGRAQHALAPHRGDRRRPARPGSRARHGACARSTPSSSSTRPI